MTMNRLPEVKIVRINRPRGTTMTVSGSFLDPEYVFHVIRSGHCQFRLGPSVYDVRPGQWVLLPPGLLHKVHPAGERTPNPQAIREHWVVHFQLHEPWPMLAQSPYVVTPDASLQPIAQRCFHEMLEEFEHQRPLRDYRLAGLMTNLLSLYLRCGDSPASADSRPMPHWPDIEKAMRLVQRQYADISLQVQDMVQVAGLSETHFARLFKDYTGHTPKEYLDQWRLRQAQRLLLAGSLNCTQIAHQTGYSTLHVFSKCFKRLTNLSPKQWLAQATQ